jgi:hypothetical protein
VKIVRVPKALHWLDHIQPMLRIAYIEEFVEGGENNPAVQKVLALSQPDTARLG